MSMCNLKMLSEFVEAMFVLFLFVCADYYWLFYQDGLKCNTVFIVSEDIISFHVDKWKRHTKTDGIIRFTIVYCSTAIHIMQLNCRLLPRDWKSILPLSLQHILYLIWATQYKCDVAQEPTSV